MKRLFALLAAAALITSAKPVTAKAEGAAIGQFCAANNIAPSSCARYIATLGPAICQEETLGFSTKGECVSFVQRLVREILKNGGL
jgi:hypothetical protein